jgi:glycerol-3-phosphate dehydrogenase (NAD(P)+)
MAKLAIVGSGAWGSSLAIAFAKNFDQINLLSHSLEEAVRIKKQHPVLPKPFPENIFVDYDYSLIEESNLVLIAVPSHAFYESLEKIKPYINENHSLAWATKGFDTSKEQLLIESFNQVFPTKSGCVISGPSFAFEVTQGKPTTLVVASNNVINTEVWSKAIQTYTMRAYMNSDMIGVEIGGAIKNVLAIAAGIASGLGFGANTQAAIITRGLSEMKRLGKALGAEEKTFYGLSGLGDLVLTCSDDLSRNRRFGKELAKNNNIDTALKNVGATVEGLNTLKMVLKLSKKYKVELPICEQVSKVVIGENSPEDAVRALMSREQISE